MLKITSTIFTILLLTSCANTKKFNKEISAKHTVKNLQEDVDFAHRDLKKLHPKLYQFISKEQLDFKFDSLKKTITQPLNSLEFYKKLAPILAEVRQGHISANPPFKKRTRKENKQRKKTYFEFDKLDFEYVDNAFIVSANYNKDGKEIINSEVLLVNNEPITQIMEQSKKLFASDGYNTTFHNRIMAHYFSGKYLRHKGVRMDSIVLQLKKGDSIYNKTFKRVLKEKYRKKDSLITPIKKRKSTHQEKIVQRKKNRIQEKYNKEHGLISSKKLYQRNFNFIGKDSSVAYLKIRGFHTGNYKRFYKNSFKKIDSAKTKNLIIDLRNNTGGRLNEIQKLYSYLTDTPFQFINKAETSTRLPIFKVATTGSQSTSSKIFGMLLSPILITHDLLKSSKKDGLTYYRLSSSKKQSKPSPLNFKETIYVLINGNSFSASSILSTHLHATKRAIFIGEETGGAYNGTVAGIYKSVELPTSKVQFNYGVMQIESPYKTDKIGHGIEPDIQITPTKKDRESNSDPELDWVLDTIAKEVLTKTIP